MASVETARILAYSCISKDDGVYFCIIKGVIVGAAIGVECFISFYLLVLIIFSRRIENFRRNGAV